MSNFEMTFSLIPIVSIMSISLQKASIASVVMSASPGLSKITIILEAPDMS